MKLVYVVLYCIFGHLDEYSFILLIVNVSITFFLEMPMLVSQGYVLKAIQNIEWKDYVQDMMIHFEFILNFFVVSLIDFVFYNMTVTNKSCCYWFLTIVCTPIVISIACSICYAPVHVTLASRLSRAWFVLFWLCDVSRKKHWLMTFWCNDSLSL